MPKRDLTKVLPDQKQIARIFTINGRFTETSKTKEGEYFDDTTLIRSTSILWEREREENPFESCNYWCTANHTPCEFQAHGEFGPRREPVWTDLGPVLQPVRRRIQRIYPERRLRANSTYFSWRPRFERFCEEYEFRWEWTWRHWKLALTQDDMFIVMNADGRRPPIYVALFEWRIVR